MRQGIGRFARVTAVSLLASGIAACASGRHAAQGKPEEASTYNAAIAHYRQLHEENPQDLGALLALSRSLRHAGRGDDAIEALKDGTKTFGNDADYQTEFGKASLVAGKADAARGALTRAIAMDGRNWDAHAALGVVNDMQRRHAEAAMSYKSALEICPDSAAILNNLALSEGFTGNVVRSISLLSKASQLQPNSGRIQQNLKAFTSIKLNCQNCGPQDYARLASAIYPQDWPSTGGSPACGNDVVSAAKIASELDQKSFIDMRVHFEFDSAALTPQAKETLDQLAAAIMSDKLSDDRFRLEGHTDAVGTDAYNQDLSARRAASVKAYLTETHKIDASRLESMGYGESRLADPANPASGVNRRVRVVKIGEEPQKQPVAKL